MTTWPLVGRDSQMAVFRRAIADRRGQGFAVYGPAGVGKSRLADECLDHAVRSGMRGRRVVASAAATAIPFGAVAHLVPPGVDLSDPVAVFSAAARALEDPERRLVVSVDDLHLLDSMSAVLLRQLMDAGVVFVIAAVRSDQPMSEAVAALLRQDAVYRVDLDGLDHQAVEALLPRVLGGAVGRHAVRELLTVSRGNVLCLRELVLGSLAGGRLTYDGEIWELTGGLAVTSRLTELIRARLSDAATEARPVLELLALCEPVSLADVEAEAGTRILPELERMDLIRGTLDGGRVSVRLAHPLYGETLRADLPLLRRRAILLRQSQRIEAHGARRRGDLLRIAMWRLEATGAADRALLTRAAALARHAHDYRGVVTLLSGLRPEDHTTESRLLLGDALLELGRFRQADTVLAEAHENACGEREVVAAVRARTHNLFWLGARVDEALAINDAARDRVGDPAGRELLLFNEGCMLAVSGRPARAVALLDSLPSDIADAADANAWMIGAQMKAAALAVTGHTRSAVRLVEHADEACHHVDETVLVPHPASKLVSMVLALSEAGAFTQALRTGMRGSAELLAVKAWFPHLWLTFHMARSEWLAGHPVTARRLYAETAAQARTYHHIKILRLTLSGLAAAAAVLGDLAAARAALRESDSFPATGYLAGEERLGEAWLRAAEGEVAAARNVLGEAARAARAAGHLTSEALLLTDLARLGAPEAAAVRLSELARGCDGELAPARAAFAVALAAKDPEALIICAETFDAIGADVLAAEAGTAAAAAWQKAEQPRRATAATLRARSALARCQGARTPALAPAVAPGVTASPLTKREREIALLAMTGASSKEIAARLMLSVRTVDNHLQRIYTKVGVTTRRQLSHHLRAFSLGSPAPSQAIHASPSGTVS
ncbi:LuxR family transcriptional regulator [Streptosporangium fragile]|uniref:LuxR family transcriptional regulator n=1 Tax=Streptosporangium fragile TaxID=46186 RepID=A0ABN3W807_9ACTN